MSKLKNIKTIPSSSRMLTSATLGLSDTMELPPPGAKLSTANKFSASSKNVSSTMGKVISAVEVELSIVTAELLRAAP